MRIFRLCNPSLGFPGGLVVKNQPTNAGDTEDAGSIPRSEDPLEEDMQPTPIFWPGEFHGLYSPWGRKQLDTTERLALTLLADDRAAA